MKVSANSVVHYTTSFDSIKGILSEGFRLKYCLENVTGQPVAFPIISFCDIPFEAIKKHTKSYGKYGIGLTRAWASRNYLNPVLYVNTASHVENVLMQYQTKYNTKGMIQGALDMEELDFYVEILSFVKNYKGNITKEGKTKVVKFYNEREWRYVPTRKEMEKIGAPYHLFDSNYITRKDSANSALASFRLKFEIEDVKYLIITTKSEKKALIEHIRKIHKGNTKNIIKLISKVNILKDLQKQSSK